MGAGAIKATGGSKSSAVRIGTVVSSGGLETRLKSLGARLIPPEPVTRDGRVLAVEISPPAKLSAELSEPQRVEFLAASYRAVLARRYRINSQYMRSRTHAIEAHPDFPRVAEYAGLMIAEGVAPLGWVLFSFDQWTHTPRGAGKKSPPPAKTWVWSKKRWKERLAWYKDDHYAGVELRTPALAQTLWSDWRCMWVQLMHTAPDTREGVAQIVEAWFPGSSFETRLLQARNDVLQRQVRIDEEIKSGGFPWI